MEGGSVGSVSSLHSLSSARSTPIPATFKPLTPCASLLALSNKSDDELRHRSSDQLLNIIHRFEKEYRAVITEHSSMMKDVNKKVQILLIETKGMKDINQSLQDDNQELRDLCCFLDDDRQRGRKLAREWQRFGRYTASVMRSEVSVYQEKLKELELRQQELISDNIELKELCLYLDQERLRISNQTRDEGDGSSSSTLAGNDDHPLNDGIDLVPVSQLSSAASAAMGNSAEPSEYVQQLEEKIRQLEGNKESSTEVSGGRRLGPDGIQSPETVSAGTSLNKPEAVVHAMKVLEVHENLERPAVAVGEDNLDDKEKAIVREMCNVVWRKLGNVSAEQNAADSESSTPHPVYENLHPPINNPLSDGPSNSSHARGMYPGPSLSQHGPTVSSSGVRSSSAQQVSDNIRQAEYHPHPGYGQADSYRARSASPGPPPYDKKSPPAYQGRGTVNNSTQSFNQSGQYGGKPANSGPQSQENAKYAYVRMSRSTPVTPTPAQQTEGMSYPPPAASSTPSSKTPVVRSHSPGPATATRRTDVSRSHSPGACTGRQTAPQLTESHNVYQNHPPPGSRRDNSYENIPVGPGPAFTSTPSSSGHTVQQQYKMNNPLNQSGDYSRQRDASHGQNNYVYSDTARDVPPSPALYRSANQPVPDYQQLRSSQGYHEQVQQFPVHYQKGPGQVPQSNASSSSIPQSSSYTTQQRPLPPYPSQQSGTSTSLAYSKTGGGPVSTGDRRPNQSGIKPGNQPYMYRQDAGNQMYPSRQNEGMKYNNSRLEQESQQYMNRQEPGNQQGQSRQNHGNQQQNYRQEYGNQMYSSRQLSGNQQGNPRQNTGNQMYSQDHASRDQFYRN